MRNERFTVVCDDRGLIDRPSPKAKIGRAGSSDELGSCRHCGGKLSLNLSDCDPDLARLQAINAGFIAEDGQVIFPLPVDVSPSETLAILDSLREIQKTHAPSPD